MHMGNIENGERCSERHARMLSGNIINKKNDRHLFFSGDAIIKANNLAELFEKLTKYRYRENKYKIKINRNKVIIVVTKKGRS